MNEIRFITEDQAFVEYPGWPAADPSRNPEGPWNRVYISADGKFMGANLGRSLDLVSPYDWPEFELHTKHVGAGVFIWYKSIGCYRKPFCIPEDRMSQRAYLTLAEIVADYGQDEGDLLKKLDCYDTWNLFTLGFQLDQEYPERRKPKK